MFVGHPFMEEHFQLGDLNGAFLVFYEKWSGKLKNRTKPAAKPLLFLYTWLCLNIGSASLICQKYMCGDEFLHGTVSLQWLEAAGSYNNYLSEGFDHQFAKGIFSLETSEGRWSWRGWLEEVPPFFSSPDSTEKWRYRHTFTGAG